MEHLTCADTAKLVRRSLKEAFPGVKFSVRSRVYSGGASIDVRWTDGPTEKAVEAIAGKFSSATFDGMRDLKEYHISELAGRLVSFGVDFIFFSRKVSLGPTQNALDSLWIEYASDVKGIEKPTLTEKEWGVHFSGDPMILHEFVTTLIHRRLCDVTIGEYPGTSELADQVKLPQGEVSHV